MIIYGINASMSQIVLSLHKTDHSFVVQIPKGQRPCEYDGNVETAYQGIILLPFSPDVPHEEYHLYHQRRMACQALDVIEKQQTPDAPLLC